jgi:Flp pilus assembly pilin Flp
MAIVGTLRRMIAGTRRRLDSESGQAVVEYALLLSLIAMVCIGIIQVMGLGVSSMFNNINTRFP